MTDTHWLHRAVIYEVFPRAFSSSGTLAGVTRRLEHIAELGATVVWLMPIHPIGRRQRKGPLGSPYSIRDFRAIHPDLGSEADLHDLVSAAHGSGLRVLLDWVGNHAAWDSTAMDHPGWVRRNEDEVQLGGEGWWDTVKLDYSNPELAEHMLDALSYWVEEFRIDGFRCDVAGRVPLAFWERARSALEVIRPDIGMLAESYSADLTRRAFDVAYDGVWYRAVKETVGRQLSARRISKAHRTFVRRFPPGARPLRYIDNHDQTRAVELFGRPGAEAAAVLLLCSEGVPLIYNGQEIGDAAPSRAPWLFERHTIDWDAADDELLALYRRLIAMRKASPALACGETVPLETDCVHGMGFLRISPTEVALVVCNFSDVEHALDLGHEALDATLEIQLEHRLEGVTQAPHGRVRLRLGPWGYLVGIVGTGSRKPFRFG